MLHRLLQGGVDRGMNAAEGEVSFSHGEHGAHQEREAAEALDTGGRRERSHSGAKEASETRKSKENG